MTRYEELINQGKELVGDTLGSTMELMVLNSNLQSRLAMMLRQPQESDDINELIHISDERFRTIRFLQQQNDQLDKLINQLRLETEDAD